MKQFAYFFDPDQLYNWKADPNEQSNLYGQVNYQPTVDHLRAVMQEQANKTPGTFKVVQYRAGARPEHRSIHGPGRVIATG
jgi:hypothetical protein